MTLSRRDVIKLGAGTSAALVFQRTAMAQQTPSQLTRTIPSSGEAIPAVGLGSARTFNVGASDEERAPLKEVLRHFHELGGRVFDTAPTYGTSERVGGDLARELGIHETLFFATKISRASSAEAGRRQLESSTRIWGRDTIDLNQVHNLGNTEIHLRTLRAAKERGEVRYVGVTTSRYGQFEQMEAVMQRETLDFVQLNYSLGERRAAERLLPLAQDRGVAVLVNEPYNAGRLFRAARGQSLPAWAAEFDCASWGQFFLKYILAHPAVTVIIPATRNPEHLIDNMGAGVGRLPDPATRRRMEQLFDELAG